MPELPEAEASRQRIADHALNRTIDGTARGEVTHLDVPSERMAARLEGRQFTETRRHGKHILAGSQSGPWIAVHLGMTGSLRVWDEDEDAPDDPKFTLIFEGGRRLSYLCPRKLGKLSVIDDPDAYIEKEGLGPDAMEIGADEFAERIGGSRGALKSALMDQGKMAGLGNLWSDELLFQAGLHPELRASDLARQRLDDLRGRMRDLLRQGIDAKADYGKLPGDWLLHHRKEGSPCPRCDGIIEKRTVGARAARFCNAHQEGAG